VPDVSPQGAITRRTAGVSPFNDQLGELGTLLRQHVVEILLQALPPGIGVGPLHVPEPGGVERRDKLGLVGL
jgi:hypothetical protein